MKRAYVTCPVVEACDDLVLAVFTSCLIVGSAKLVEVARSDTEVLYLADKSFNPPKGVTVSYNIHKLGICIRTIGPSDGSVSTLGETFPDHVIHHPSKFVYRESVGDKHLEIHFSTEDEV